MVQLKNIRKQFGPTTALDGVSLDLKPGSVTVLLGENGSGKSTLVKILAGVLGPDSGTLTLGETPVKRFIPQMAQALGIQAVFQEVLVTTNQTVWENLIMGPRDFWHSPLDTPQNRKRAEALLAQLAGDQSIALDSLVETLTLSHRQIVAVTRALIRDPRLLILDESTSALDVAQRNALLAEIGRQATEGTSVIFISHRMDEVLETGDQIVVLRAGRLAGIVNRSEANVEILLGLMSGGRAVAEVTRHPTRMTSTAIDEQPLLRVENLQLSTTAKPISCTIGRGQMIGVAGLEGHGQQQFVQALAGLYRPVSGQVFKAEGNRWSRITSLTLAGREGIAYVPRDRKSQGILPTLSVLDNFSIANLPQYSSWGLVSRKRSLNAYRNLRTELDVVDNSPDNLIVTLSGGNQQKVLLARYMAMEPTVLILDDPTRGVDAGTKQTIYAALERYVAAGHTVVLLSTEITELLALCERIWVFYRGELAVELNGNGISYEDVVGAMFGQQRLAAVVPDSLPADSEAISLELGRQRSEPITSRKSLGVRFKDSYGYSLVAMALFVLFTTGTAIFNSSSFGPSSLPTMVAAALPLVLAGMAQAPVILGGGGGIDLSVGALMGLVNAVVVGELVGRFHISSPAVIIGTALAIGALSGLVNGFLVVQLRLQPIVATLGTFLAYEGLTLLALPSPGGSAPAWLTGLGSTVLGIPGVLWILLPVIVGWILLSRLPWYRDLLGVGDNDHAAYASGVNVSLVRLGAYVVAGLIASAGGLALTALLSGGDPTVGVSYTLIAIAGAALGGLSLMGGRGGMWGASVGALDIFIIEYFLTYLNVSTFALQVADGLILVVAIILNTVTGPQGLLARRKTA